MNDEYEGWMSEWMNDAKKIFRISKMNCKSYCSRKQGEIKENKFDSDTLHFHLFFFNETPLKPISGFK